MQTVADKYIAMKLGSLEGKSPKGFLKNLNS